MNKRGVIEVDKLISISIAVIALVVILLFLGLLAVWKLPGLREWFTSVLRGGDVWLSLL